MKQSKTKATTRKFYNKWVYKVSLSLRGAGVFRNVAPEDLESYCMTLKPSAYHMSLASMVLTNKKQLLEVADFLKAYSKDTWAKRIETNQLDIYTNDLSLYQSLSTSFDRAVIHKFEPTNLTDLDAPQVIVGKKLPHDQYRYRVYLLPHKMSKDKFEKRKYLNWIEGQGSKIRKSKAVDEWFMNTDWNWDRRYVLVEDESTLLMLKLRNAEVVGRVYNYVVSDK